MRKGKWICTDIDNKQYGRKMTEKIYEFKEYDKLEKKWLRDVINLDEYTNEQMKDTNLKVLLK